MNTTTFAMSPRFDAELNRSEFESEELESLLPRLEELANRGVDALRASGKVHSVPGATDIYALKAGKLRVFFSVNDETIVLLSIARQSDNELQETSAPNELP